MTLFSNNCVTLQYCNRSILNIAGNSFEILALRRSASPQDLSPGEAIMKFAAIALAAVGLLTGGRRLGL
jgi:hypothetical protein